jgi:8-oxo-dGTP diphosphatase
MRMSEPENAQLKAAVLAFIYKDGKLLLQRRVNTGWEDGNYSVPAGRVDVGELPVETVVREIKEETGLIIKPEHVEMIFVDYVKDHTINFCFKVTEFEGEPQITEPEYCDEMIWVEPTDLPSNIAANGLVVLNKIAAGEVYAEFESF